MVKIIERYKTHSSIRLVKKHVNKLEKKFSFEKICYEDIQKEETKLDKKKASHNSDILKGSLKKCRYFHKLPLFKLQ